MMSLETFEKKKIIFVFTKEGEKIAFQNENLIVKDHTGEIKLQSTCYRIFAVMIVGNITITSVLIEKSHKFGFPIFLMTQNMRTIDVIGHGTEGNFILNRKQYDYTALGVARHIVENKIHNQMDTLNLQRGKDNQLRSDVKKLQEYAESARVYEGDIKGLMGIEGSASRVYFRNNFDMPGWTGRKPKIKGDFINSTLDIGYTILFNMVDALLRLYGFDTYIGVYHREFYKRKSLVCDMVEPFRPLIDWQVRKAVHLGQCKQEDFNVANGRHLLTIEKNKDYTSFLVKPLLNNKSEMFNYFKSYYRAFIKGKPIAEFPTFRIGDDC